MTVRLTVTPWSYDAVAEPSATTTVSAFAVKLAVSTPWLYCTRAPVNAGSSDATVTLSGPVPVVRVSEAVGSAKLKLLLPLVNDRPTKLTVTLPGASAARLMSRLKMEPVNTAVGAVAAQRVVVIHAGVGDRLAGHAGTAALVGNRRLERRQVSAAIEDREAVERAAAAGDRSRHAASRPEDEGIACRILAGQVGEPRKGGAFDRSRIGAGHVPGGLVEHRNRADQLVPGLAATDDVGDMREHRHQRDGRHRDVAGAGRLKVHADGRTTSRESRGCWS